MVHRMVPAERQVRKTIHMILQFVGLVLGIFGVYVAYKFHKESQIPDMYTLHSWLGMVTICLFGLLVPFLPPTPPTCWGACA